MPTLHAWDPSEVAGGITQPVPVAGPGQFKTMLTCTGTAILGVHGPHGGPINTQTFDIVLISQSDLQAYGSLDFRQISRWATAFVSVASAAAGYGDDGDNDEWSFLVEDYDFKESDEGLLLSVTVTAGEDSWFNRIAYQATVLLTPR